MTDPVMDWKSGSGGEHQYTTIFIETYENYELMIFNEYSIGKVCMSIEIRIIRIMRK